MTRAGKLKPSASALDNAVEEYRRHAATFSGSAWDMGDTLRRIRDQRLYRARHRTWEAFLATELDITRPWAALLVRTAENFTRDQVEAIGPSRLDVVRRAPKPARPRLLREAAKGATVDQLKGKLPKGTRRRPGKAPKKNATKEQKRKREHRRRQLEAERENRGPTEREIAASIVETARPVVVFGDIVEASGTHLREGQLEDVAEALAERLDRAVHAAVVATVRAIRKAETEQPTVKPSTIDTSRASNIEIDTTDPDVMRAVLLRDGVDGSNLDRLHLAAALATKYEDGAKLTKRRDNGEPVRDLLCCDVCGGPSPKTEPVCPFCGTGGISRF